MGVEGNIVLLQKGFVGLLLSVVVGCGGGLPDLGKDGGPAGQDAGPDADAHAEAAPPPACNTSKPFAAPVALAGADLVTGLDYAPSFSADELTMWFSSARGTDASVSNVHIYMTTRSSLSSPFGPSTFVAALNGPNNDSDPLLSPDGLTIYFQSDRIAGNNIGDIYVATRSSLGAPFVPPTLITIISSVGDDTQPALDADGALWFARQITTSGYDLYRAAKGGSGFAVATEETELNTPDDDWSPALSADGLTIFFASTRTGGSGSNDVWVATRAALSSPFSAAQNVTELNTSYDELPHWLSPDGPGWRRDRLTPV